jgi:hypothetical protein
MIPSWACKQWGNYEHDWLDCPDCLQGYETYLEEGAEMLTVVPVVEGNDVLEVDVDTLDLLERDGYVTRNSDPDVSLQYNPAPGVTFAEVVAKVKEQED